MLFQNYRRLLLNIYRQNKIVSNLFLQKRNEIVSLSTIQIRHSSSNEKMKRKILLKMNTALNENDKSDNNSKGSDTVNISCLNNELILSERLVKFPFNYRCLLEQQLAVCQDRWVSENEWNQLYNIVGQATKPLFASVTLLVCVQLQHIDRGRSLYQFVQQHHPELLKSTSTTYSTYMNLLALQFFSYNQKQDSALHEKEICDIYEKYVKDKHNTIVASAAAVGIIKGLCATHLWRDAYSYLPFVDPDQQSQATADVILAALHSNDISAAIKLISNMKFSPPNDSAAATFSTILNDMIRNIFRRLDEKNENAYEFINCLFQYLSTLDTFIEKTAVDEIENFFKKYENNAYKYGTTLVFPNGTCKQLSDIALPSVTLPEEDFTALKNYLLENAYTAKEVYNTTTPMEFERFKNVLAKNNFTMIIDGLNILYGIDRFASNPVGSMTKTIKFLKNLHVQRTQMLFIARKHALSRIPYDIQNELRSICEIFLVDNTSRDDWFVLYAALNSKAYVLTSDILRKERGITNKFSPAKNAEMNDKLQKWLYRYQYMFIRQGNRVYFKQPMAYQLRAQSVNNIWLIPYFNSKPTTLAQRPEHWFFVYENSNDKQKLCQNSKTKSN